MIRQPMANVAPTPTKIRSCPERHEGNPGRINHDKDQPSGHKHQGRQRGNCVVDRHDMGYQHHPQKAGQVFHRIGMRSFEPDDPVGKHWFGMPVA